MEERRTRKCRSDNLYKNLLCLISLSLNSKVKSQELPSIGIVGGGIGGTSCAYFLKSLWGSPLEVTIFEKDAIGGRLDLTNIDGKYYESGGSVIHLKNKYMVNFAENQGLKKKWASSARFGIYNGDSFVFEESHSDFMTKAKLLWRYGFSGPKLQNNIKQMLDDFKWVYEFQRDEVAFTTVTQLMKFMHPSFFNMTQQTLYSYLSEKIDSKLLLDELVQSIMMVNYGQTNNISAFAGFVSLAGADNNLWSVDGGNKRVPENLLQASNASIVNGDVAEIERNSDATFSIKYKDGDGKTSHKEVDIVVLALPLVRNSPNIVFKGFTEEDGESLDFRQFERTYHRTIATFVKGTLNPSYFNTDSLPDCILTNNPNLPFNSIGIITPVDDDDTKSKRKKSKNVNNHVYKIFSNRELTADVLDNMFNEIKVVKQKEWTAYPEYHPSEPLPPFVLAPSLYYVNAIEMAASAMEMSVIGAKNVALLAFDQWTQKIGGSVSRNVKEEL